MLIRIRHNDYFIGLALAETWHGHPGSLDVRATPPAAIISLDSFRPRFSYPDWHGTFYPPDFRKGKIHELQFLSEFFDFCEINNSFYRPVNPEVAKKWCEYVTNNNKEFQFTAKLTEVFTHAPGRGNKESSSAETIRYTAQDNRIEITSIKMRRVG